MSHPLDQRDIDKLRAGLKTMTAARDQLAKELAYNEARSEEVIGELNTSLIRALRNQCGAICRTTMDRLREAEKELADLEELSRGAFTEANRKLITEREEKAEIVAYLHTREAKLEAARSHLALYEVWDDSVPPGGYVCAAEGCGVPVESEPCTVHWRPAQPDDTPGTLLPGDDDTVPEIEGSFEEQLAEALGQVARGETHRWEAKPDGSWGPVEEPQHVGWTDSVDHLIERLWGLVCDCAGTEVIVHIVTWDWRGQPNLDTLDRYVYDISCTGRPVRITPLNRRSDQYAIAITDTEEQLSEAEAEAAWARYMEGWQ